MKNQQAISSADLYGGDDYGNLKFASNMIFFFNFILTFNLIKSLEESDSITSKLKDFAWGFTVKAAEKAKSLKDKTTNMINKIQQKYGQ